MITVVTALSGGKDRLRDDQIKGDAKWVAYTDGATSNLWEVRPVYDRFTSDRRNSRIHKILIHEYVNTRYSIWIDANIALLITPEEIVDRYLKDHDIAIYKHPARDCLYEEAVICATRHLDNPETIIQQVKTYEDAGYGKHKGLVECSFIARRHTDKVREFNEAWWAEYCRHSVRDQISCMYAVDNVGINMNMIDAPWIGNDIEATRDGVLHIVPHLTAQPEPI